MAAFRLVYLPPATAPISHTHHYLPLSPPPNHHRLVSLTTTTKPQRFNLHLLHAQTDQTLVVSETPQQDKNVLEENPGEASNTRVFVQNLPWTCTVDDLRSLFQPYGTVVDIEFSMYNKTRNRGLAFVSMASHEEALAALTKLDSTEFEGRVIKLNWAIPKKEKPTTPPQPKPVPVHNLFVANLPFQARAKDLKDFFNADNVKVVSAEVIFSDSPPRRSLGYGFVSFNTKAEAEAALAAFDGKEFMGRSIRVARSKTFLRDGTKAEIELESATKVD